jgi:hypothetical protein
MSEATSGAGVTPSFPDFAEPVIGRRFAPTRWRHPGYSASASGHGGHGETCCRLGRVANDPITDLPAFKLYTGKLDWAAVTGSRRNNLGYKEREKGNGNAVQLYPA